MSQKISLLCKERRKKSQVDLFSESLRLLLALTPSLLVLLLPGVKYKEANGSHFQLHLICAPNVAVGTSRICVSALSDGEYFSMCSVQMECNANIYQIFSQSGKLVFTICKCLGESVCVCVCIIMCGMCNSTLRFFCMLMLMYSFGELQEPLASGLIIWRTNIMPPHSMFSNY